MSSRQKNKAILIFTDNAGLPIPDEPVIDMLLSTDTVVNGVIAHRSNIGIKRRYPPRNDPSGPDYTNQNVFHIAAATGGDVILATDARSVRRSLTAMLSRIRSRYDLWFRPAEASNGAYKRIEVRLSESARERYPGAEIRARKGYYSRR